jgi:hypothetical protein
LFGLLLLGHSLLLGDGDASGATLIGGVHVEAQRAEQQEDEQEDSEHGGEEAIRTRVEHLQHTQQQQQQHPEATALSQPQSRQLRTKGEEL